MNRRVIEVESLEQLQTLLTQAGPDVNASRWRFQSLDLRGVDVSRWLVRGAVFLGCTFESGAENRLRDRGALIFPVIPDVPFNPYRSELYTPAELYGPPKKQGSERQGSERQGEGEREPYELSVDGRIYQWSLRHGSTLDDTLATSMHDHAISDALSDFLRTSKQRILGIMGGHVANRGTATFRQAAELGCLAARAGFTVATGGGPGAMEAANLGARFALAEDATLRTALVRLERVPSFRPSVSRWAQAGLDVSDLCDNPTSTLGVPTWFYGHEPPNVFATHIAKYFANAIREDTLLSLSSAGVIVLPGEAGTVQEIFQNSCENFYAAPGMARPLVLLGREYFSKTLPVWPLIQSLAQGREMATKILVTDSIDEAVEFVHQGGHLPGDGSEK